MAATSRAKRMKNRNVARRNLSKLPKPSKATNNGKNDKHGKNNGKDNGKDNCKDNGKDGGKDNGKDSSKNNGKDGGKDGGKVNGKDGGKDGGKDNGKDGCQDGSKNRGKEVEVQKELEKDPDEASEDGGWRPKVSRHFILKRLETDQAAAPKMQVSLAWAILRTPEADKDAWDATRTYAEKIWSESGIPTAAQGKDRFWTMCDDILAQPVWDKWRVVYAIGNRNHDGTLEAGGLLNEMNGEHYVSYAILSIIRNWSTKRKEREVRRHKRVLEDPETPRSATRARVYLPITPMVTPVRPADPDNELQAELLQLAKGTPAAPNEHLKENLKKHLRTIQPPATPTRIRENGMTKRRFHPPEFDPAPISNEWKASSTFKGKDISRLIPRKDTSPMPSKSKTVPNLNSFEGDERLLITMANRIAQAHIILKEPFMPSPWITELIRDSWEKAIDSTGLEEVGIQLCGGEYLDANCPAYKIRQAISNAVRNYRKMVQTNLTKEHYFGLGKLDEKSVRRKVVKLLDNNRYIFESDDQEKRENPYLTKVIARCMFDHFFSKDGSCRTADPYQDLLEKMNPTMICLTAFLIEWNLQAWRTGKFVPLAQLNSDSRCEFFSASLRFSDDNTTITAGFEFHKQLWDKNYESHEETAGAVDYMRHLICVIKARPELQSMDMSRASEAKVVVFGDRKASAAALRAKLEVEKKKLNEELEESGYSSPLTDLDD
ncbi:hypothetical protein BDD12DRAFT_877664 [Trichophaea hybrida]|nr:hypothetical protein BDD12DRAFT_877664 [Trichophaea hybrida]